MNKLRVDVKKFPMLFLGFFFLAFGLYLAKLCQLGMNPWSIFNDGLSKTIGVSFGRMSQLVGIVILVITLFFRFYPGIGTILNIYFIGLFIDLFDTLGVVPYFDNLLIRVVYLFLGIFFQGLGAALYLKCALGAGPRDGLMIVFTKITKLPVKYVKPIIESTVTVIGVILGGTIGIGSLISTFVSGYVYGYFFKLFGFSPKKTKHRNLVEYFK